jgi:hypothetical protein
VTTWLGRSEDDVDWGTPVDVLVAFAEELGLTGVPLCHELAEMVLVDDRADDVTMPYPTTAIAELLSEPMTAAETASTLLLATVAARARDANLDDDATRVVARFESYVAELGALHPR